MLNFEEIKPKLVVIDNQMKATMTLRQGDFTNEDFIKLVMKELKACEKHGGNFLWGATQEDNLENRKDSAKKSYLNENGTDRSSDLEFELDNVVKKHLKE